MFLRLYILYVPVGFLLCFDGSSAYADTVILRDRVGQLIGTIVHQSTSAVVIDVVDSGVFIPIRRSDVVEIISSGGSTIPFASPDAPPHFDLSDPAEPAEIQSQPFRGGLPSISQVTPTPMNTGENTEPNIDDAGNADNGTKIPFSELPSFFAETPAVAASENPIVSELLPMLNDNALPSPSQTAGASGASLDEDPVNQPLLPVVIPKGNAYQVTGGGVRFREGPGLDYPIVTTLAGRTVLIEIENIDGWLHAKTLEGVEGWIHTNFVQPMENLKMIVKGDRVHVRESAGEIYRSLERLRRGEVVVKLDERPGWYFILTGQGVAGWSSAEFLEEPRDLNALTPEMRAVNNDAVNSPVLVERGSNGAGQQNYTFTVRDGNMVVSGKTKLCVLRNPDSSASPSELQISGEGILGRQRLLSSNVMVAAGIPESLALEYTSIEVIALLGSRTTQGWEYRITTAANEPLAFAFIVQKGPNRGVLVRIP